MDKLQNTFDTQINCKIKRTPSFGQIRKNDGRLSSMNYNQLLYFESVRLLCVNRPFFGTDRDASALRDFQTK